MVAENVQIQNDSPVNTTFDFHGNVEFVVDKVKVNLDLPRDNLNVCSIM